MYIVRGRVKPGSGITKSTWYRLLVRNMRPGPNHGRWEPVTRHGFLVVACSKIEAYEVCFMLGQRYFGDPGFDTDEGYIEWLLRNYIKLEQWTPLESDVEEGISARKMEMSVYKFLRGWVPGTTAVNHSATTELASKIIRERLAARG